MKFIFFVSAMLISTQVFGSNTQLCSLKALNGGSSGVCSDEEFSVALWNSDFQTVNQKLKSNPNLLYSCNFSTSYVYNGSNPELMNPLVFSVCHSKAQDKRALIQTLLNHGADQEINCETANLKITAKFCLDRISDEALRTEIEALLKTHGMN